MLLARHVQELPASEAPLRHQIGQAFAGDRYRVRVVERRVLADLPVDKRAGSQPPMMPR